LQNLFSLFAESSPALLRSYAQSAQLHGGTLQINWAEELRALLGEAITLKKNLTEFSDQQGRESIAAIES
jgi:hypothetical protein